MVKLGLVKRECVATSIHITVRCSLIVVIIAFGFIINSCVSNKYHQHKYTSLSKTEIFGKPIQSVAIHEYENYKDLLLDDLELRDIYFIKNKTEYVLEDRYFMDMREIKYNKTYSARGGDFLEDSLKKHYPLQKKPRKLNILNDETLKFIEYGYDIDDYLEYDSIPRFTLKSIIKPNKAYKLIWDKGKWESPKKVGKVYSSTTLSIELDSNRNITEWEEVTQSFYYRELPGRSVKGRL